MQIQVPSPEEINEAAVAAVLPLKNTGLSVDDLIQLAELVKETITEFFNEKG